MAQLKHRLVELIAKKQAKRRKRLTIAEIADEAGVSRQLLYNWLNHGIGDVRNDTVTKLCLYFDCEVGDLLYLDKEEA